MSYSVYAGRATLLYEQRSQYKDFLKRVDFNNHARTWMYDRPFADFLGSDNKMWDIRILVSYRNSAFGGDCIEIITSVYILFLSQADAVQFKLTYEPNIPEVE